MDRSYGARPLSAVRKNRPMDHGAIVIGAGHNGLITATYLARAGIDTLLVEARDSVGGCASTVDDLGARFNICNCDHQVFRSTPVIEELGLAAHGLAYLDTTPSQIHYQWDGGPPWAIFHEVEPTIEMLRATYPHEVAGYKRYLDVAKPVAELVLEVANRVPTARNVLGTLLDRRMRGVRTMLRWSRMSASAVLRTFFTEDALMAPVVVNGPAVWGLSPETPRTGMGAIGYAIRHSSRSGRPVGGSGAVPASLRSAFTAAGGKVQTGARVVGILCRGEKVRGVELADGTVIEAPVVVSACDPTETFVNWLRHPPASAAALVRRYQGAVRHEGYESKVDAVVADLPRLLAIDHEIFGRFGIDANRPTTIVAPSLQAMHEAQTSMSGGDIAERPIFFMNTPSVLDPTMAPSEGGYVFSLEVLWTPYSVRGGWPGSGEPRRWLEQFASLVQPGWLDGVRRWRAMTPNVYEEQFQMPGGYATSFAGSPLTALMGRDPELTRYETPVKGLYLTGAATFPGAGIWGAPGRNAAHVVLAHER